MIRLLFSLLALITFWQLVAGDGGSALARMRHLHDKRTEQIRDHAKRESLNTAAAPVQDKRDSTFSNSKSKPFAVNGSALPDVDWDLGESYAGLLPISDHPEETRQLYFWYFPSTSGEVKKRITIWLQGGPGAALTAGLLLENGPILYQPGTVKPRPNSWSWTNLTNMVWIDQPVGTGFSVGTLNITNEFEMADQFMGFFRNFVDAFNKHGYKVYLTGESYSGYYIPYIANGFLDANDTKYFNFAGAAINDPIIGNEIIQFEGVAMQYLETWAQTFGLSASTMNDLRTQNKKCHYSTYLDKYFRFPPLAGPFPGIFGDAHFDTAFPSDCDIQASILDAVTKLNPCFNFDHIFDTCPIPYNPLGVGIFDVDFNPPGPEIYYNRPEVRKAIHAPPNVTWALGSAVDVFTGKKKSWEVHYHDVSLPPTDIGIVSRMIEATDNIIVGAGGLDFQLPANGTLFVFQNMTWGGTQGFSKYPDQTLFVPPYAASQENSLSGHGDMGVWRKERGLTFYVSFYAGHEAVVYAGSGVSSDTDDARTNRRPQQQGGLLE